MSPARGALHALGVAVLLGPSTVRAQDSRFSTYAVVSWSDASERTVLVRPQLDWRKVIGRSEARAATDIWLDIADPDESIWNFSDVSLTHAWSWTELRAGVGFISWGISDSRSPIDVLVPKGMIWNSWDGVPLGQPLISVALYLTWGTIEAVVFPVRRSVELARPMSETGLGEPIDTELSFGGDPSFGARVSRVFGAVDLSVSYIDGWDRTVQLEITAAALVRPVGSRIRQGGVELQWAVGPIVVRSEGALFEREGGLGGRLLAGAEWYPTAYLAVQLEQGWVFGEQSTARVIEDDLMLAAQLLTEEVRLGGRLFIDPRSGNRHFSVEASRSLGTSTSLTIEWTGFAGDRLQEPILSLRQPEALVFAIGLHF